VGLVDVFDKYLTAEEVAASEAEVALELGELRAYMVVAKLKKIAVELVAAHDSFVKEFEKKHGRYRGAKFSYEHPGVYVYSVGGHSFFFTPDYDREGFISVEIQNDDGDSVDVDGIPDEIKYESLAPDSLFNHIKPYLDKLLDYLD
jgi:hypothetical protein